MHPRSTAIAPCSASKAIVSAARAAVYLPQLMCRGRSVSWHVRSCWQDCVPTRDNADANPGALE